MAQYVYSPAEDVAVFKHNNVEYPLVPNGTTAIVSKVKGATDAQVAQYAVERLGMWGVCLTSGPVKVAKGKGVAANKKDQAIVDAAEAKYREAMLAWAEQQVMDDTKVNEPRVRSGLGPKHTNEYLRAQAWLKKNASKAEGDSK